jgi:hypothetical protein
VVEQPGSDDDVRLHPTGSKRLHHPVVGDLELTYEAMESPADQGLTIHVYAAGDVAGGIARRITSPTPAWRTLHATAA